MKLEKCEIGKLYLITSEFYKVVNEPGMYLGKNRPFNLTHGDEYHSFLLLKTNKIGYIWVPKKVSIKKA